MTPTYANILNYKVNATELVLEFGAFFPMPGVAFQSPSEANFHTRIVMGADIVDALVTVSQEMKKSRDHARELLKQTGQSADKLNQGNRQ